MLIIVEGCDGVGKSTLVHRIVELLHSAHPEDVVEVRHKGPPTEHPLDEYVMPLRTYRPGAGHHVICDRWHLGELVYPEIFNRRTLMDRSQHRYIDGFLRSRGAFLAHIHRYHLDVIDTLETRGDDLVSADQALPISVAFESAYRASTLEKHSYDIGEGGVARAIINAARYAERQAEVLNRFVTYVGSHDPIVLLLGDVRGPRSVHPQDPAFAPYPSSSGAFLLKAITGVPFDVSPSFIGMANACDVDSVPDLIATLTPSYVVALGQNAATEAAKHVDSLGVVPHPQFIRRFHHASHIEYGSAINTASTLQRDMRSWRP